MGGWRQGRGALRLLRGRPEEDAGPPAEGGHRITLIGKPGCHLCDEARAVITRVAADLGVPWEERDITTDPGLYRTYAEQIPVTLIDGRQHDFWRVDEARLRSALGGKS